MSSTHRKEAAKKLSRTLGIPYQQALNAIIEASGPERSPSSKPAKASVSDGEWAKITPVLWRGPYPSAYTWNEFPLGLNEKGNEVVLRLDNLGHVLIVGATGTGKTNVQRIILQQACLSHETWRVILIDPKRVELNEFNDYPQVLVHARSLEDITEALQQAENEMTRRYQEMETAQATSFRQLKLPAILVVVDELYPVLAPEGIKSDEGKKRDEMHALCASLIGSIARLGRAAGVHLCLATQRPDARILSAETRSHIDNRIALGRMDTTPSLMILDSDAATGLPPVRGVGILRRGLDIEPFRMYWTESHNRVRAGLPLPPVLHDVLYPLTPETQRPRAILNVETPGAMGVSVMLRGLTQPNERTRTVVLDMNGAYTPPRREAWLPATCYLKLSALPDGALNPFAVAAWPESEGALLALRVLQRLVQPGRDPVPDEANLLAAAVAHAAESDNPTLDKVVDLLRLGADPDMRKRTLANVIDERRTAPLARLLFGDGPALAHSSLLPETVIDARALMVRSDPLAEDVAALLISALTRPRISPTLTTQPDVSTTLVVLSAGELLSRETTTKALVSAAQRTYLGGGTRLIIGTSQLPAVGAYELLQSTHVAAWGLPRDNPDTRRIANHLGTTPEVLGSLPPGQFITSVQGSHNENSLVRVVMAVPKL